jgi:hypothetical protein
MSVYNSLDIDKYLDYLRYFYSLSDKVKALENELESISPGHYISAQWGTPTKAADRPTADQSRTVFDIVTELAMYKAELMREIQEIANFSHKIKYGWTFDQFKEAHTDLSRRDFESLENVIKSHLFDHIRHFERLIEASAYKPDILTKLTAEKIERTPLKYLENYTTGTPPKITWLNDFAEEAALLKFYNWLTSGQPEIVPSWATPDTLHQPDPDTLHQPDPTAAPLFHSLPTPESKAQAVVSSYLFGLYDRCIDATKAPDGTPRKMEARRLMAQILSVSEMTVRRNVSALEALQNNLRSPFLDERPDDVKKVLKHIKRLLENTEHDSDHR